mmetsp:Transcript_13791/g.35551  ORF Transcript_13791/g.35551 Transcript_13791/m.35551 type:complete len:343 (-) Transcript_13791:465-1493(-)
MSSSPSCSHEGWPYSWPGITSNTPSSVMMRLTTRLPVRGSVHMGRILCFPPLAVCSIVTTTRLPLLTRSIAPPIPLTILPGMIQLARSPFSATSSAPSKVSCTLPARIMPNEVEDEKVDEPGIVVTVSFPALIMSGSSSPSRGYGPMPSSPFSDWSSMRTSGETKLDARVGIPMPRFTYMPSSNSIAARFTMRSRSGESVFAIISAALPPAPPPVVRFSMRFSYDCPCTTWCTYTPGRWTSSAGIAPACTISSTSAMQIFPAIAASTLKLRPVPRKTRLPRVSAFHAFTRAKSPTIACSRTKSRPLKLRVSRGLLSISTEPSLRYLIGAPPSWMIVPAAHGV